MLIIIAEMTLRTMHEKLMLCTYIPWQMELQDIISIFNAKTLIELKMEEYEPNTTCNHFKTFE